MAETCAAFGVAAGRRDGHPGCWCDAEGPLPRKIGALGIRVERGVSYHGIALNVTPDLADFDLIDPCGMPGLASTSIAAELRRSRADATPSDRGGRGRPGRRRCSRARLAEQLGAPLAWRLVPGHGRDGLTRWRQACSSSARTRSPAGGSPPSWTGPSTATGSPGRRCRSTTAATARTAASPPGDGIRMRMLKDFAFHVVGTDEDARELDGTLAQVALSQARASGSWRTIVAPPERASAAPRRRQRDHRGPASASARDAIAKARAAGQTDYLQVVQNWGAQAGARTNHLCLDLYDLPQIPHRVAEELGGAARFVIREGECPWCRLVRDEPRAPGAPRLAGRRHRRVRAVRVPLAVRGVGRAAPPRGGLRAGRRRRRPRRPSEALRQVLGRLAAGLDGPPYNLVLHTAPLREQVDATYHWHWEIHPRLREIAGLELGTGLPVNPVSPEDAVEELLGRIRPPVPEATEATG